MTSELTDDGHIVGQHTRLESVFRFPTKMVFPSMK